MRTTLDDEQPSVQTGSDIKLSSYSSYNKTEVGEVTPKTWCAIASSYVQPSCTSGSGGVPGGSDCRESRFKCSHSDSGGIINLLSTRLQDISTREHDMTSRDATI